MRKIYLDNNATTALDPRVLEAMMQDLGLEPANPSSVHFFGQEARAKLQNARKSIADFFQVLPHEIIFSSGGTESLNMLIRGFFDKSPGGILTTDTEHSSVFNTVSAMETQGCFRGCPVVYLPSGSWGAVKPNQILEAIQSETRLIVLSAANGETGVKTDIEAIAKIALERNIPFVVDGIALLGKETFTIAPGISAMAFSGHKIHGPKGIGFAFVRSNFKFTPQLTGGDQEYSKRAGTENLAGILGLAKAIELLTDELPKATEQMRSLRDRLENSLKANLENVIVNGLGPRLPNTSNLCFPEVDGETLLIHLDLAGIAVSHGSACASGALEPSRVLLNMGVPRKSARSSIRFSLSRQTTQEDIDTCIEAVTSLVRRLKF